MKGELEWKVGKWAGVPVRPGIAHWERKERMESKERELEGGVQGEGKGGEGEREEGSGNGEKVKEGDEEIEQGISTVAISQGEKLEEESPPPQVECFCWQDLKRP